METLKQFEKQKYLNIETFRKNGQGVKTPVWFVQEGETLRVWTNAGAGKIKRIRNNGSVRVMPSTVAGEPLGDWVDAQAIAEDAPEAINHVAALMRKKYGLQFLFFNGFGKIRKSKTAVIKLTLS